MKKHLQYAAKPTTLALAFGLGAWVSYEVAGAPPSAHAGTDAENPYFAMQQTGRALALMEAEYVDPVDRKRLVDGAVRGMVSQLDPHSSYMNREEYRAFLNDTAGQFGGIGIEVDIRGDVITVVAPIEGSPAERAGVRSGDRVIGVDGDTTQEHSIAEVMKKLRGEPGTKVKLVIRRNGVAEAIVLELTREIIKVRSVVAARLEGGFLYIRIKQFQSETHAEFMRALAKYRGKSPFTGVLLDVRSNPGGLVDEATAIADEFLDGGAIYSMRTRGKIVEEARADSGGALTGMPVVALVNEWSASASELLVGALQDQKRARIVGVDTFGKGSVQTIMNLPGGAGLKLTTARYYTPNGHAIQADGVHPDVKVVASGEGFPFLRERDLEGALPGEGIPPKTVPIRVEQVDASKGEIDVPREIPVNPLLGKDPFLKIAYEELRRMPGAAK
jgi:carboxyl-terminal processing protease